MTVKVAPKGTDINDSAAWTEIGTAESITWEREEETVSSWFDPNYLRHVTGPRSFTIELDDDGVKRTIYAPSATFKKISDAEFEICLDTYSFPQRHVLGIDQESSLTLPRTYQNDAGRTIGLSGNGYHPQIEVPSGRQTVLNSRDVPQFAHELFDHSRSLPKARVNLPGTGEIYISAGTGPQQARVNLPKTRAQAERNLNFAIANLKAYHQWETVTEPMLKREEDAKAKAEAEAKAASDRLKAGLDLYNQLNGTRHVSWSSTHVFDTPTREKWAVKAEEITKLKRDSNPWTISGGLRADQIMATTINAGQISPSKLSNRLFGF